MLVRKFNDPLSFGEDRSTGECDKLADLFLPRSLKGVV